MKTIRGYIYNKETNAPIENVVVGTGIATPEGEPTNSPQITTLTNGVGEFTIVVPDNQAYLKFYKVGTGTFGESYFYIPQPTPAVWNIGLSSAYYPEVNIVDTRPKPKKMWPYYALGGLALILFIRKMRKSKKR